MRTAVCPGSFDPITNGHLDVIERAAQLFDQLVVLVLHNPAKKACFSLGKRIELLEKSTQHIKNVSVEYYDGLLAEYLKKHSICAIVKGLRALSDFEYEFQMALANRKLYANAETLFLTAQSENMYVSSSLVRQIGRFHGEIDGFVPPLVCQEIQNILYRERGKEW